MDKWTNAEVCSWVKATFANDELVRIFREEDVCGQTLLAITEHDLMHLRTELKHPLRLGDIKRIMFQLKQMQRANGLIVHETSSFHSSHNHVLLHHDSVAGCSDVLSDRVTPPCSVDGRATCKPELFKTMVSLGYAFLVTWITAFVMVVVHERVPDMKRYPPLPDIFLDNVPVIPWAFHMCELTGVLLFSIWACVLVLHKHRFVLLRRFFALAGTVFLLRCVTMLITSLSVPGTHLECTSADQKYEASDKLTDMVAMRINRAYNIWSGLGMTIHGVRTCGDYMFSGHTVALTLLNFFITEYTPRNLYFLHTMTWLLNMFGIFFILAGHEHYSIDVFVAFYITSRLFLYYHTLSNNHALMSYDSNRTRIWFPMFSYFESSVDGIIPNEYDSIPELFVQLFNCLVYLKDLCMLTGRRFWMQLPESGHTKIKPPRLGRSESQSRLLNPNGPMPSTIRRSTGNLTKDESNFHPIKVKAN